MALISKKTILDGLLAEVNGTTKLRAGYLSPTSFEVRRLLAEADKLMQVDAFESYMMRAIVSVLTGNIQIVRTELAKAKHLEAGGAHLTDFMEAQALGKLGYFSQAQSTFKMSTSVDSGEFGFRAPVGLAVGAFSYLGECFLQAEEMKLQVQGSVDPDKVKEMVGIMLSNGLSDCDVGGFLNVAGEIIRKRCLFIKEQSTTVQNLSGVNVININFYVGCAPQEASDMLFELAEEFAELPRMPQGLHIGFRSI